MEHYNIIFCVLTYKNHTDLEDFIFNLKDNNKVNFSYKIIVVNNYADNESLKIIKDIAIQNNCIFIENENTGYGHGNNKGIEFAKEEFSFDFLVVCNPDTVIKKFDFNSLKGLEKSIIAPEIICNNGKRQNPLAHNDMPKCQKLAYFAFKYRIKTLLYTAIITNKINRYVNNSLMNISKIKRKKVFECHGSYIIFSSYALEKLFPVFDNNIFLFCEESDLAKKAESYNVEIVFNKEIVIFHKEDGSMNLSNNNLNEIQRKSFIYFYEKWNGIKTNN